MTAAFPITRPALKTAAQMAAETLATGPHSLIHSDGHDELLAVIDKVGLNGTADSTTHDYKIGRLIGRRTFSNAPVTALATDGYLAQIGTMSASRVVTLPAAAAFLAGQVLRIVDESGTVTAANTLVITRVGADTINGATTNTLNTAYGAVALISDGTSKWTTIGNAAAAGAMLTANNLSELTATAATARTNLGLLGMATQAPSAVAITGGTATLGSVAAIGADAAFGIVGSLQNYGTSGPVLLTRASKGSLASPTSIQSTNTLFSLSMQGQYDTVVGNAHTSASITALASENFDGTHGGAQLRFSIRAKNAAAAGAGTLGALREYMRVDPSGCVNINRVDYSLFNSDNSWVHIGGFDTGVDNNLSDRAVSGTKKQALVVESNTESGQLPTDLVHMAQTIVEGTGWESCRLLTLNMDVYNTNANPGGVGANDDTTALRNSTRIFANTERRCWAQTSTLYIQAGSDYQGTGARALELSIQNYGGHNLDIGLAHFNGVGDNTIRHQGKWTWQGPAAGPEEFIFLATGGSNNLPPRSSLIYAGTENDNLRVGGGLVWDLQVDGAQIGKSLELYGQTGSVQTSRWVGATTSGAPTTGAHNVGDWVIARNGHIWICTATAPDPPGTWVDAGSYGSGGAAGDLLAANNLSDVANTDTAFANLSPTGARGDMIVRGSGANDVALAHSGAPAATSYLRAGVNDPVWTNILAAHILDAGTMITQNATAVNIDGGTVDGISSLSVNTTNTTFGVGLATTQYGTLAGSAYFRSAHGTLASPTKLLNTEVLWTQNFSGQYDTTVDHFNVGAQTIVTATEDFDVTHGGARMGLFVRANNASGAGAGTIGALTETLRLTSTTATVTGILAVTGAASAASLTLTTPLALAQGGTGATDQAGARTALGLTSMATMSAAAVAFTGGTITGITDLAVADGGTGASDAPTARTNLGLVIGTNVQAQDTDLQAIADLGVSAGLLTKTGDGTASVRTVTAGSTKLTVTNGSGAAGNPTIDIGTLSLAHLTDGANALLTTLADAKGDLLAASAADTFVRVAVGTNGQVLKADSAAAGGVSWLTLTGGGDMVGANNLSEITVPATARTNLGLGNMAVQAKTAVDITGGTVVGITSLSVKGDNVSFGILGSLEHYQAGTVSATLFTNKGRGTTASPAAAQSSDVLFSLLMAGQRSTTVGQTNTGAQLVATATELFDSTHGGARLGLFARANNASGADAGTIGALVETLRLTDTTAAVTGALTVSGAATVTGALAAGATTITGAATVSTTLGVTGLLTATGGITNPNALICTPQLKTIAAITDSVDDVTATVVRLNNTSGAPAVLTSAPQVADGTDGQILIIFVSSSNSVTFSDQGTVASSNLRLGATTRTVGPRDSLVLLYNSNIGDWIELMWNNVT